MAIPKSGARRIIVDAIAYRWRIRPRPTTNQTDFGGDLTVAVEQKGTKGAVLLVRVDASRPDCDYHSNSPAAIVLPAHVAGYIRLARASGWISDRPGSPFYLQVPSTDRTPPQPRAELEIAREESDRRSALEDLIQKLKHAAEDEERASDLDGETFMANLLDRIEQKRR